MSEHRTPLRLGFVPGVVPDKWVRRWRERFGPIDAFVVETDDQRTVLDDDRADLCLVRVDAAFLAGADDLHVVRLYAEEPVVVMSTDHLLTLLETVTDADLADEIVNEGPPRQAVETAAAGTGVALMPASVARINARKDVTIRPYADGEESQIALAWLRAKDGPRAQDFVGIVKGRREGTSR